MDTFIDYKRALLLVQRINKLVEENQDLSEVFLYRGYNLWQSFQAPLFVDVKLWTQYQSAEEVNRPLSFWVFIKDIVVGFWMVGVSGVAVLVLLVSRTKILVFSGDRINGRFKNDFRLEPLYEALDKEKKSFLEIVHGIPGRKMFDNFIIRRRPVIYLEVVDPFSFLFVRLNKMRLNRKLKRLNLPDFTQEERRFVKLVLAKYTSSVEIFKWRVSFFRNILRMSAVSVLFAIDDVRYYNELMFSANMEGIKTYAVQHGHFTKYHTGWLRMTNLPGKTIKPDHILVWSEYWKNELLRLGTYFKKEEIVVAGQPINSLPTLIKSSVIISILIPYETDAPKKEVLRYIEKFLTIPDVVIIFKTRPDQNLTSQLKEYGLLKYPQIEAISSTEDALQKADVVLGTYSTFLYDAVSGDKPIALLDTSIDYGEGMILNGLAEKISLNEDMLEKINYLKKTTPEVLTMRRQKLVGTEKRLSETIQGIISRHV